MQKITNFNYFRSTWDHYAKLLEQPDLPFVKLKKLPAQQQTGLLKLPTSEPVKRFLVCVSQKEPRLRVADPGVRAGAAA